MYEKEPFSKFLNKHYLYRGVPKILWKEWDDLNEIEPTFFMLNNAIDGLSVDWSKYTKPSETLERRNKSRGLLKDELTYYGIIQLNIGDFKEVKKENELSLKVEHDPQLLDRSHSLIQGIIRENVSKVRMILSEIAQWAPNMNPKRKGLE